MALKSFIGDEKKCPVCKKPFIVMCSSNYAWKISNKFFCGWNCLCAYRKAHKEQKYLKGEKG